MLVCLFACTGVVAAVAAAAAVAATVAAAAAPRKNIGKQAMHRTAGNMTSNPARGEQGEEGRKNDLFAD